MGKYEEIKALLKRNFIKEDEIEHIKEYLSKEYPNKEFCFNTPIKLVTLNDIKKIIES